MLNKKLTGNIMALFTLKGAEYVVSFVTLPYLLRVLGPEHYGMVVFAQTVMNYGNLLVDYGFNLTAPRDIAKADRQDIPRQFAAIMVAKLCLLTVTCVLVAGILYVCAAWLDLLLILCVLPALLGNAVFPVWFFQGTQQMRFITIFNLVARIISVVGIFLLVHEQSDYRLAALLQSLVPLMAGCISLAMLFCKSRQLFQLPSAKLLIEKLKDGWEIFLSTIFISFYTNSNIFILRLLTDDTCVGYFAAASKLIDVIKGTMMPVSTAIFPHVSSLVKKSRDEAIQFLGKAVRLIGGLSFALSLLLLVFADFVVSIVMGDDYGESVSILRIISFLPFIIGLSNIFGIQTMVAFGMQKLFSQVLMVSAGLNFVLAIPMICLWGATGLAVAMVCVESFVTIAMYVMLRRSGIKIV